MTYNIPAIKILTGRCGAVDSDKGDGTLIKRTVGPDLICMKLASLHFSESTVFCGENHIITNFTFWQAIEPRGFFGGKCPLNHGQIGQQL